MAHQITARLTDLKALAAAVKELEWYTGGGGYILTGVTTSPEDTAVWSLEVRQEEPKEAKSASKGKATAAEGAGRSGLTRRVVEAGDQVVVETKGQQMARRYGGADAQGEEGVVFRVLTRGPHPHGMKVELRDGTVGRVKRNLTVPGAGEPSGRR